MELTNKRLQSQVETLIGDKKALTRKLDESDEKLKAADDKIEQMTLDLAGNLCSGWHNRHSLK